jgi:hypothetical protein
MYFVITTIIEITIEDVLCIFTDRQAASAATDLASGENTMADPTDEPNGRTAVAAYVATMSNDLAGMARRTGLDTLGYLLEMVRLEAESVSRHNGTNGRRSQ